jgi:hypothetical protein
MTMGESVACQFFGGPWHGRIMEVPEPLPRDWNVPIAPVPLLAYKPGEPPAVLHVRISRYRLKRQGGGGDPSREWGLYVHASLAGTTNDN